MSVAALVLGIIATIIALIPILGMYAIPIALLALTLGALGRRGLKSKGLATAGFALGLLGTGIGVFQYTLYRNAKSAVGDARSEASPMPAAATK